MNVVISIRRPSALLVCLWKNKRLTGDTKPAELTLSDEAKTRQTISLKRQNFPRAAGKRTADYVSNTPVGCENHVFTFAGRNSCSWLALHVLQAIL